MEYSFDNNMEIEVSTYFTEMFTLYDLVPQVIVFMAET